MDDGLMKGCVVEVFPTGQELVGSDANGMLAHEITHCLQLELLGVDGHKSLAPWLKEGATSDPCCSPSISSFCEAPRGPLIALGQTVAGRVRGLCC